MEAVRKIIDNPTNPLSIEIPEEYEGKKVEVIIRTLGDEQEKKGKFSEFFGKLNWKRDAVAQQRKLR